MLDLNKRGRDVRQFVTNLENWVINTLAEFSVIGEKRDGRIGVWVRGEAGQENKIAAIGVRVRKWVSFHGICINVEPDLSHYTGIVPCGISDHGVTSLINLGRTVTMNDLDEALQRTWCKIFENQDQTL
jgi:lipoyl(octanoyl) transferase